MSIRSNRFLAIYAFVAVQIAFTAPSGHVVAQDIVTIQPNWSKGDSQKYVRTKHRFKSIDGKVQADGKASTELTVQVLETGKNGHVLSWVWGDTTSTDPRLANNDLLRRMSNLVKGIEFELQLNEFGGMESVRNLEQVKKPLTKVLDAVVELTAKNRTPEQIRQIRGTLEKILLSKEGIEKILAREPHIFLMAMGVDFQNKRTIRLERMSDLPIPGNLQVPTVTQWTLKELHAKNHRATIEYRMQVDPVKGDKVMRAAVEQLARLSGSAPPEGNPFKQLNHEDKAEIVVDTVTGWPIQITHTRSVRMLEAIQRDTISFSKKD